MQMRFLSNWKIGQFWVNCWKRPIIQIPSAKEAAQLLCYLSSKKLSSLICSTFTRRLHDSYYSLLWITGEIVSRLSYLPFAINFSSSSVVSALPVSAPPSDQLQIFKHMKGWETVVGRGPSPDIFPSSIYAI